MDFLHLLIKSVNMVLIYSAGFQAVMIGINTFIIARIIVCWILFAYIEIRIYNKSRKKLPVFPLSCSKILGSVGQKRFCLAIFYRRHILTLIVLVQKWQKKNF